MYLVIGCLKAVVENVQNMGELSLKCTNAFQVLRYLQLKTQQVTLFNKISTSSAAQLWAPLAWSSFSFSRSSSSLSSSGPWKDFSLQSLKAFSQRLSCPLNVWYLGDLIVHTGSLTYQCPCWQLGKWKLSLDWEGSNNDIQPQVGCQTHSCLPA